MRGVVADEGVDRGIKGRSDGLEARDIWKGFVAFPIGYRLTAHLAGSGKRFLLHAVRLAMLSDACADFHSLSLCGSPNVPSVPVWLFVWRAPLTIASKCFDISAILGSFWDEVILTRPPGHSGTGSF